MRNYALLSTVAAVLLGVATNSFATSGTFHIVHFGDSVTDMSPGIHTLMEPELRTRFGTNEIYVHNVSKGGRYIERFMSQGDWYDTYCAGVINQIDLCFIQFGINDDSFYGAATFKTHLAAMCDRIESEYPGVRIVLCTSMPVKNASWWTAAGPTGEEPLSQAHYQASRDLAAERGYLLVDIYEYFVQNYIIVGDWSFRIAPTDLHPSPAGVQDICDLELSLMGAPLKARNLFYNNSGWDENDPAINASDDAAIATNKTAILPFEIASFANYSSFSKGINGIMVDIAYMPGVPTAGDFEFRVGNDDSIGLWPIAPAPSNVTVRAGAGMDGSDRVTLTWADGAIQNQWLQVTAKANATTGLIVDDVFYFGNAIGETGDSLTDAEVTPTDEVYVRNNPATLAVSSASISHAGDFNRDKKVGPTDQILCRNNGTNSSTALQLISTIDNEPPSVDAGLDATIVLTGSVSLTGLVDDDGWPSPPNAVTTTWSKLTGPGVVTFGDASALATTATFSVAGTYVLQLEADDDEQTSIDTVQIEVVDLTTFFADDFEDNDLVGWTNLSGSFETFQFIGQSNYEVHALAASSRMRADLTDTNLDDIIYMSLAVRHTGGAEGGSNTGNKAGHIWFVDDSGAGFGLYTILSQTGAGLLDIYSTTDDGATSTYVGNYTAPAAAGGNGLKQIELVYDRVADEVECIYEGSSIGTIAVSSAYRDFTRVVVSLADMYISFGDPVIRIWGQLDVDDIKITNSPVN